MPDEQDVTLAIPKGRNVRVIVGNNRGLNGMFLPMAIVDDECVFLGKLKELTKPALRLMTGLCNDLSTTNRVVFVSTGLKHHEELCELQKANLIARPTASQYRRRKGFTTVLVNPNIILTTDDEMYSLWDRVSTNGLSAPSPPPCGGLEE